MTQFAVHLSDGRVAQIEATEVTARNDASLWFLQAVAPPPAALVTVAVFARGTWTGCFRNGVQILWVEGPRPVAPEKAPATPRFA